jgi:4,5-dihydroxyphthalate decarboxylase
LRFQEFDVSELSLSSYVLTLNQEDPPFIALPVFPSRYFRHQSIYINKHAGIKSASDLKGKKVGVPEWQMTAPVWQRGILEDEYGVPYNSPKYFTGAVEPSPTQRIEKLKLDVEGVVQIERIPQGKCLSEMLRTGEIDALYSATRPSSFSDEDVDFLFPNFKAVEAAYYRKTSIFPIMHVIALKRSVYKANPWIVKSLTKAFAKSLDIAYDNIEQRGALKVMLPWLEDHLLETKEIFGEDRYWQDGLTGGNRRCLEKFLEYSYHQGLAKKKWAVEDIFAKEALEEFVV